MNEVGEGAKWIHYLILVGEKKEHLAYIYSQKKKDRKNNR